MDWTADRIKALRESLGLSQAAFAEVLGLSRTASVNDLEKGRTNATGPTARLLTAVERHGPAVAAEADGDVASELDAAASKLGALARQLRSERS